MVTLNHKLGSGALIGLDTSVFIHHLEAHPEYLPLTRQIFDGLEKGRWRAVTSTIVTMEIGVRPWQLRRPEIAYQYDMLLAHFPGLELRDVTREVALEAARLRSCYALRAADALIAATALLAGAGLLVTNDASLGRLAEEIEILLLGEHTPRR